MSNIDEEENMEIKCKNKKCQYKWEYKGKSQFYAQCPRCRRIMKIKTNKEEQ